MESIVYKQFKTFFDSLNVSVNAFSKQIGLPQRTVNNYITGDRSLSVDFIEATLAAFPELSAEWLLRGRGSMYGVDVSTSGQIDNEVLALRSELNGVYKTLQLLGISLQPQQKKAAV